MICDIVLISMPQCLEIGFDLNASRNFKNILERGFLIPSCAILKTNAINTEGLFKGDQTANCTLVTLKSAGGEESLLAPVPLTGYGCESGRPFANRSPRVTELYRYSTTFINSFACIGVYFSRLTTLSGYSINIQASVRAASQASVPGGSPWTVS